MSIRNCYKPVYPQWYITERETEKILKRLYTVKELDYYLKNSDEYIRRLAIIRLGELKLKESINVLSDILEDPMENSELKNLASWVIKSTSVKWSLDLFTSNKYLSRYTGNERLNDLYRLSIIDNTPSIKFDFSSSLIGSELEVDNNVIRTADDINFESDFTIDEWFKACSYNLSINLKKVLVKLPVILFAALKKAIIMTVKLVSSVFKRLRRVRPHRSSKEFEKSIRNDYSVVNNKFRLSTLIKNAVINLLRVIFFPLRMILKHKKAVAALLVVLYLACTYTTYGRIATSRYWGVDLRKKQNDIFFASKEILSYAWGELEAIIGINDIGIPEEVNELLTEDNINTPSLKQFKVIAKTGLNLRELPDASSKKVTDKSLESNLTVVYLSKSQEDESGRIWYYIQTPDGKTGWAYSKWLEEIRGE